jgi:succinoglycan biosynthesis transport protein ExoP
MPIADLIRALAARWKLELAIVLAITVLGILWIAVTPRAYLASASVLIDTQAPQPVTGQVDQSAKSAAATLATEAKIIRSEATANRVVDQLGLEKNPLIRDRWRAATGGLQSLRGWLARSLLSKLSVATSSTDNILSVGYEDTDSRRAAQLANAFAANYVGTRLQLSTDPARTYADWFEKRIAEARGKVEKSQQALSDFQRDRGIISTGTIDAESTRLGELSSILSNAQAQSADARSRAATGGSLPEVQSSAVIQGLRAQIASKSATIQQMRSDLGPNHPEMRAMTAELRELNAKLASETGKTSGSLGAASAASNSREAQVRALLEQQRSRMLALASDRSKLQVLESEAESARQEYTSIAQQLNSMRLRSTLPATNARLLDRAEAPMLPNSPNVVLRFLLTLIFGVMLAIAVAVALEWRRPRVRSAVSLVHLTGAPLLSSTRFAPATSRHWYLEGSTS